MKRAGRGDLCAPWGACSAEGPTVAEVCGGWCGGSGYRSGRCHGLLITVLDTREVMRGDDDGPSCCLFFGKLGRPGIGKRKCFPLIWNIIFITKD